MALQERIPGLKSPEAWAFQLAAGEILLMSNALSPELNVSGTAPTYVLSNLQAGVYQVRMFVASTASSTVSLLRRKTWGPPAQAQTAAAGGWTTVCMMVNETPVALPMLFHLCATEHLAMWPGDELDAWAISSSGATNILVERYALNRLEPSIGDAATAMALLRTSDRVALVYGRPALGFGP